MDVHKKQNFIVSTHIGARWVTPGQPAEPIFLTQMLQGPAGAGRAG